MKTSIIHKFLMAILIFGVVAAWNTNAAALKHKEWQKLPKLLLQECIAAEREVQHNPLSKLSNDLLVITAYREYRDDGAVAKESPEAKGNTEALNVYLMVGVLVSENRAEGIVRNISLVVTERVTDATGGAKPILRQWILLDLDGDGVLDKAIFSEGHEKTHGSQDGVDISSEQMQSLQDYFVQAVHNLNKKVMEGPSIACAR